MCSSPLHVPEDKAPEVPAELLELTWADDELAAIGPVGQDIRIAYCIAGNYAWQALNLTKRALSWYW